MVSDGISEAAIFRNDGHSEIFDFVYTGKCGVPRYILAKSEGTGKEAITWQTDPANLQHRVQYRKAPSGGENRIWFEAGTTETNRTLYFLEPGTTYEYRVGGQCIPEGGHSFSAVNTFTTADREDAITYNYGIPLEILITNWDPLEALSHGDKFTAGDFTVTVVEVSGGNGTFSGRGHIQVPYLALIKIAVVFRNIDINTDGKMTGGTVETAYDAGFESKKLAILKKWSTMQFEADLIVAKGSKLNLGKMGPQKGYSGGANQILLPLDYPEECG